LYKHSLHLSSLLNLEREKGRYITLTEQHQKRKWKETKIDSDSSFSMEKIRFFEAHPSGLMLVLVPDLSFLSTAATFTVLTPQIVHNFFFYWMPFKDICKFEG
jgi:hypothetical protein